MENDEDDCALSGRGKKLNRFKKKLFVTFNNLIILIRLVDVVSYLFILYLCNVLYRGITITQTLSRVIQSFYQLTTCFTTLTTKETITVSYLNLCPHYCAL